MDTPLDQTKPEDQQEQPKQPQDEYSTPIPQGATATPQSAQPKDEYSTPIPEGASVDKGQPGILERAGETSGIVPAIKMLSQEGAYKAFNLHKAYDEWKQSFGKPWDQRLEHLKKASMLAQAAISGVEGGKIDKNDPLYQQAQEIINAPWQEVKNAYESARVGDWGFREAVTGQPGTGALQHLEAAPGKLLQPMVQGITEPFREDIKNGNWSGLTGDIAGLLPALAFGWESKAGEEGKAMEAAGSVEKPSLIRPTTKNIAGVDVPISALQAEKPRLPARMAGAVASPEAAKTFMAEQTQPAATYATYRNFEGVARGAIQKLRNVTGDTEPIEGGMHDVDRMARTMKDESQKVYENFDQASDEELEHFKYEQEQKKAATPEGEEFEPDKKPESFRELQSQRQDAIKDISSGDPAKYETAKKQLKTIEQKMDEIAANHTDLVSPDEYRAANNLRRKADQFDYINQRMLSIVDPGTDRIPPSIRPSGLKNLPGQFDKEYGNGAFTKLMNESADGMANYRSIRDVLLNPKTSSKFTQWLMTGAAGTIGTAVGEAVAGGEGAAAGATVGVLGKMGITKLADNLLFNPDFGQGALQAFSKATGTAVKFAKDFQKKTLNLLKEEHGEAGLPGTVGTEHPNLNVGNYDNVEMVPTSELDRFKEYNRSIEPKFSQEEYNALRDDIKQNGIKEPLMLEYGSNDKKAFLGEGNTRLAIAKELGIKELPVRVLRRTTTEGHPGINVSGFQGVGHVPADLKPSEIGINKNVVGTAQGAAQDTALFQQARQELGENASISDVAKRAQELKDQNKATGTFGNSALETKLKGEENIRPVEEPDVPPFYSKAEQVINEKVPNNASGDSIKALLANNGVKQDELQWTGLDDFLKDKAKVSKAELQQFIHENQIQVKDVDLGKKEEGFTLRPNAEETAYQSDHMPMFDVIDPRNGFVRFTGSEQAANDYISEAGELSSSKTKYDKWTLPGEKSNYQEKLLTLPEQATPRTYTNEETGSEVHDYSNQNYASPHWQEPNVVAHVRFDDRPAVDGKKTLFMEEAQSDWHSEGRHEGYKGSPNELAAAKAAKTAHVQSVVDRVNALRENLTPEQRKDFGITGPLKIDPNSESMSWQIRNAMTTDERDKFNQLNDAVIKAKKGSVPDAPFKQSWHELVMKRMLRQAAENGYDRLAWTTGEQQADLYDLSKHISKVEYDPEDRTLNAYDPNGRQIINESIDEPTAKEFAPYIGQELAEDLANQVENYEPDTPPSTEWLIDHYSENYRILEQDNAEGETEYIVKSDDGFEEGPFETEGQAQRYIGNAVENDVNSDLENYEPNHPEKPSISGLDLRRGGEFHKLLYDTMIPSFLKKYAKKWGAKVGETEMAGMGEPTYTYEVPEHSLDDIQKLANKYNSYEIATGLSSILSKMKNGLPFQTAVKQAVSNGKVADISNLVEFLGGRGHTNAINQTVHSIEITPAMKKSVMKQGQPISKAEPPIDIRKVYNGLENSLA